LSPFRILVWLRRFVNAPRRSDANVTPDELYKAAKLDSNGEVKSKGKEPMAEDGVEDDGEAGPELPPDFEEDVPDDEEGRFFGGGMDQKTAQAMEYIDRQEEEEAPQEKFDAAWVRRFALNFEKKISKNAELRAKFENDGKKYVAINTGLLLGSC
jgi:beta-catenin-like protein 1